MNSSDQLQIICVLEIEKCRYTQHGVSESSRHGAKRTVLRSAEGARDERLDGRQAGEVADRPPLMIVESGRRRYQLQFGAVDGRRHSDAEDGDAGLVCSRSFGHSRQRRRRRLAVRQQHRHPSHVLARALNSNAYLLLTTARDIS